MEGSGARGEGSKVTVTSSVLVAANLVAGTSIGMKTIRWMDRRRLVKESGSEPHLLVSESRKATTNEHGGPP
jgi:hypothetical protein